MKLPQNIAYSKEYAALRQKEMSIFDEYDSAEDIECPLSNGDIAVFRDFEKKINEHQNLHASKFHLIRKGKIIYSFDMPIDNGNLLTDDIIEHKNGNQYLLFNTELYGYSVLNISTLKDYHYIPEGRLDEEESFIWVNAQYCSKNNLLWVGGCYWGCPGSTLIVDFSSPENMPFPEYDLMNVVEFNCDIDPVEWTKDGDFVYDYGKERITLPCEKLFDFFELHGEEESME